MTFFPLLHIFFGLRSAPICPLSFEGVGSLQLTSHACLLRSTPVSPRRGHLSLFLQCTSNRTNLCFVVCLLLSNHSIGPDALSSMFSSRSFGSKKLKMQSDSRSFRFFCLPPPAVESVTGISISLLILLLRLGNSGGFCSMFPSCSVCPLAASLSPSRCREHIYSMALLSG